MTTEITKEFNFSYGHLLPNHDGKCRNLHGHNAKVFITVSRDVVDEPGSAQEGMVMDFGDLKKIVNETIIDKWDHKFLACGDEWPVVAAINTKAKENDSLPPYDQIVLIGMRTTAENMAGIIYNAIREQIYLAYKAKVTRVRFYETETSYADYVPEA